MSVDRFVKARSGNFRVAVGAVSPSGVSLTSMARRQPRGFTYHNQPMANWFKFYETDLDDANLQYAMDHNPHTAMVYLGLLTECCKIRGNTLPWTLALELPALAKKVHLSIGVTNDAVGWLRQIGRVSTGDGIITVTGWESRQSVYMNRKVNHQFAHSQTEERRRDKRGAGEIKVKRPRQPGEGAYLIASKEGHQAGADAIVAESIERVTKRKPV